MRSAKRRVPRRLRRRSTPSRSGFWSGSGGRQRLQFLAGLEANSFAGRDANLLSRAGVAADAGLARLHIEYAEAAELDAFAAAQRVLHGLEDGFHGLFGFCAGNIRFLYDSIYDVELDHTCLPLTGNLC